LEAVERIGNRLVFFGRATVIQPKVLNARVDGGPRSLYQARQSRAVGFENHRFDCGGSENED